MKNLLKFAGTLDKKTHTVVAVSGFIFILMVWYLITSGFGWIKPATIPPPQNVFLSYIEMFANDDLVANTVYSVKLNFLGYIEAIAISIPFGFLIALLPVTRSMFSRYIDALRYVPLTGLIGIFIAWFGITLGMKVHFLAFGIIVYLLPTVVQRVYETEKIHIDTIRTLGANNWQTLTKVYFPSVLSKLSEDIRILTAISYTYIIVAEMVNNEGGVGAMIYSAAKQSRLDKIFAIILLIMLIGFLQDKLFQLIDKKMFKFKYV
ncbi:MAG: ABC transporter permease subunit [Bacteroidia bacterium]|nr:ABC transporter permease subunit [Bacteroidia bacterium]